MFNLVSRTILSSLLFKQLPVGSNKVNIVYFHLEINLLKLYLQFTFKEKNTSTFLI